MTNPNVPANQADAAKGSAPDAKVMGTQPAQLNQANPQTVTSVPVGTPGTIQATPVSAGNPVPVDAVRRATTQNDLKTERAEDQRVGKELAEKNKSADYFQEVANNDAIFQDPFREAARQERLREDEANKGDPTRDPVAKQAKMDMNTPEPGAQEEAAKMRK